GGDVLREAVIVERRNRQVQREARGLQVPGSAIDAEPGQQSLERMRVERRRVAARIAVGGAHLQLEAPGASACTQLRVLLYLEKQLSIACRQNPRGRRRSRRRQSPGRTRGARRCRGSG